VAYGGCVMIRLTLPGGSVELTEEQAHTAILELQAALLAFQEAARNQAREAKAAALWAEWLAAGAIPETSGGLLLRCSGWEWLRPGSIRSERPPPVATFVAPVWGLTFGGTKAHCWLGTNKRWCGRPDRLVKVVDPKADGVELCKMCAKAFGGAP